MTRPDSDKTPPSLHLCRLEPAQNMRRFYRMEILHDLFGQPCLLRSWGRMGTRGQVMIESHPDEAQARAAMERLAQAKQRRGYRPLTTP